MVRFWLVSGVRVCRGKRWRGSLLNASTENNATAAGVVTRYNEQVVFPPSANRKFSCGGRICTGGSGSGEGCAAAFGRQGKTQNETLHNILW